MEITKREILVSIVIVALMTTFGFMIAGHINDKAMEKQQEYNVALQIDGDSDLFQYGMKTNIGNAFVYGEVNTVDPVTYEEIGGEYSYVKKVQEEYTRHVDYVTHTETDEDGNTSTWTEEVVTYSWDEKKHWHKCATTISFLDVEFPYETISFANSKELCTIYESKRGFNCTGDIRYVYYGAPTKAKGTIYTKLSNNTITKCSLYNNLSIEETVKRLNTNYRVPLFWVFWIIFTIALVIGFYYLDNWWLEDK